MKSICSRAALAIGVLAILAGCATPVSRLQPGMPQAEVVRVMGPPTDRYPLADGGTRLEYASGPYGEATWMVDLDRDGRMTRWAQVLTDEHLSEVQGRLPGMTRAELLRTLGRPAQVRGGGLQGGQVWSWRFDSMFCRWFQVSIGDDGIVRDGIFSPDPQKCGDDDNDLFNP